MTVTAPLILASGSPRRRSLLEHIGLSFDVIVSSVDETVPDGMAPDAAARRLARRKGRDVARDHPDALTVAADTVVALGDEMLEKPGSPAGARDMLRRLRGGSHDVYTGLALHQPSTDREVVTGTATTVSFGSVSDAEIDAYVDSGLPMDKAGGYGIQDPIASLFVDGIEGDYYNVVGLPLRLFYVSLREHFPEMVEL